MVDVDDLMKAFHFDADDLDSIKLCKEAIEEAKLPEKGPCFHVKLFVSWQSGSGSQC